MTSSRDVTRCSFIARCISGMVASTTEKAGGRGAGVCASGETTQAAIRRQTKLRAGMIGGFYSSAGHGAGVFRTDYVIQPIDSRCGHR